MRKYWNALLYGNKKTKRILISVILLALAMIVGVVLAANGLGAIWGLLAAFAAIMDIVLIQSVRFGEVTMREKTAKEKVAEIKEKVFEDITQISAEDVKQLLLAYKVSSQHVPVLIDSYEAEGIRECPAYIWRDKGYLNMLLFEDKPRNLAIPMSKVTEISYKPAQPARPSFEYEKIHIPSFMNAAYMAYLPTYQEKVRDGKKKYIKNLYCIEPGIYITNTSAKNAAETLKIPFSFTGVLDNRYSYYYKEAYQTKILLLDRVLSAEDYKERIGALLKQMADSEMSFRDFTDDVERMVQARLITREVADYHTEYRQKKNMKRL
ncbi:MAG: hypothetical protein IJY09_05085 [Lachnospiraceae bacterium]|nr:hypothetical protein [Lachnospiraceae bacterium]